MVFIIDEGSVFNAPIEKVWRLNGSEGEHNHASLKNSRGGQEGEHPTLSYETAMSDGSWVKHKVKMTLFPPVAVAFETVEGPMSGSKSIQYYTPKGDKTGVTVVGNWTSTMGIPDSMIRQSVMAFLDAVFEEDQNNLSRIA